MWKLLSQRLFGLIIALFSMCPIYSANWLMLQGTEPTEKGTEPRFWGFVQPEVQYTSDTRLKAGPAKGQKAAFNQIRPDLDSNLQPNVIRSRLGVRGKVLSGDSKVNYFVLAEFGYNGITKLDGYRPELTDVSITLNFIPQTHIRLGQFKYPGAEEGLQGIHVFDYINFSEPTNQLLLERFFDGDGSNPKDANQPERVGAFRDIGIQFFNTFEFGEWELSPAVMVGNGAGINRLDFDLFPEIYLYGSAERVFDGKGPRRDGLKLFGWYQKGTRRLKNVGVEKFNRTRYGGGVTYRRNRIRFIGEYVAAEGMVFNGTDAGAVPGAEVNAGATVASFNVLPNEHANGWLLDFGFRITPKWEIDFRYDRLNRGTKTAINEKRFDTVTLGIQYFFRPRWRALLNYQFRWARRLSCLPA